MANIKIFTDMIDKASIDQISTIGNSIVFNNEQIRIMPDVHAGKGCVCGFTSTIGDKIIPNLIGVDIGCGVYVISLGKVDIDFNKLDNIIRTYIPFGTCHRNSLNDYINLLGCSLDNLYNTWKCDINKCIASLDDNNINTINLSIGTLGSGNHFIEIDKDADGNIYLIIHTGSRKLGHAVCKYWQNLAYKNMQSCGSVDINRIKNDYPKSEWQHQILLQKSKLTSNINKDLAYLEGDNTLKYLQDLYLAMNWADLNRYAIGKIIIDKLGLSESIIETFTTVHNYIDKDDNIIRKSAIKANAGQKVLIPLNMADGSLICLGKGNSDWNNSAPHGAGRLLSRSQAKSTLNMEDYKQSMQGIWTTSICNNTLDESRMAYKPADKIKNQIIDTVDIIKEIKPIYNFKADN